MGRTKTDRYLTEDEEYRWSLVGRIQPHGSASPQCRQATGLSHASVA
jgi:hypothetical protein